MTTPNEAIQEILAKLDLADDTNWTEDGSPALGVIQKLANDPSITRAQINDANPGFARVSAAEVAKTYEDPAASTETTAPKRAAKKPTAVADEPLTEDEMRKILTRRVTDAELHLTAAQAAVSEAQAEVVQCQKRLARAHDDHNRRFPRITASANIKAHLASQIRQAEENAGISPLQTSLTNRKRPVPGAPAPASMILPRRSGAAA